MWSGATVAFNSKKARGNRTESGQLISRSITLADSGQTWQTGFHFFIFFLPHSGTKVGKGSRGKYQGKKRKKKRRRGKRKREKKRRGKKEEVREEEIHA